LVKGVKIVGTSDPLKITWAIVCWEIRSPMSEKLNKKREEKTIVRSTDKTTIRE
jgi:hypothetical protein